MLCLAWTRPFSLLCKRCYDHLPLVFQTQMIHGLPVYSFYLYEEIEMLLKSKYKTLGSRILSLLSQRAREYFYTHYTFKSSPLYALPIDDHIKRGYSHTAIIANTFCKGELKNHCKAVYAKLMARSNVTYAGTSYQFRQKHKKDFVFKGDPHLNYFLVDDVLTTGSTMQEAIKTVTDTGARVIFALVLARV
ncbi:ComF family protein [Helicobacter suis]|uniref:ComF family protein n=1 Tax=Helicobacter suis TaxID=104628 RepID=UPI001F081D1F|nr:ComF family protein [Helicobacter suis]